MYSLTNYPPRSRFDLIPAALQPHIDLADEATKWLNFHPPDHVAQLYEPYITHLDSILDSTTMPAIRSLEPDTDGAFEATLALFTVSAHQFRWKHVPVLPEYRAIKQLDLPRCLKEPLLHLTHQIGLPLAGSVHALVIYNYSPQIDGARFRFNSLDDAVIANEHGWTKLLYTMENESVTMFHEMIEICHALDREYETRADKECAIREGLERVRKEAGEVFKRLHTFAAKGLIRSEYFAPYIEGPHGWGIDGVGGASGAQMLPVTSLDALLSIKGESMMYRETIRSREAMTFKMREFLEFLDSHAPKLRFFGHLDEFSDLISVVYNFRLGHRKIGVKFLAISDGTAGGKIQLHHGEEMIAKFNKEMGARIAENVAYLDQLKELYGPPTPHHRRGRSASLSNGMISPESMSGRPSLAQHHRRRSLSDMASDFATGLAHTAGGSVAGVAGMFRTISETSMSMANIVGSGLSKVFRPSNEIRSEESLENVGTVFEEEAEGEGETETETEREMIQHNPSRYARDHFNNLVDKRLALLKDGPELAEQVKRSHESIFDTLEAVNADEETVLKYVKDTTQDIISSTDQLWREARTGSVDVLNEGVGKVDLGEREKAY